MIGCIIITVVMVFSSAQSSEANADRGVNADSVEQAGKQWQQLMSITQQWSDDNMTATVKWQGTWNTLLSPEEAAGVLTLRLGFQNAFVENVQGHNVYSSYSQAGKIRSKLTITPQGTGVYYVMLRMEAGSSEQLAELSELQLGYGELLIDEGVAVHWNGALQGNAKKEFFAPNISESSAINTIEKHTVQQLQMKQVESYDDLGTASRTYEVEGWPIAVFSGTHKVSLQLGVHFNAGEHVYEISVGSPLLTVEY
ncbi:hypothetical protein D3C81_1040650 [compost metagenome]